MGWVSLSEGIQKFLYSDAVGVGRFATIGIPSPEVMAPLVGVSRSRAARCSCWWSAAVDGPWMRGCPAGASAGREWRDESPMPGIIGYGVRGAGWNA